MQLLKQTPSTNVLRFLKTTKNLFPQIATQKESNLSELWAQQNLLSCLKRLKHLSYDGMTAQLISCKSDKIKANFNHVRTFSSEKRPNTIDLFTNLKKLV